MRAVMKRELKNYLKNPIYWVGLLLILVELFMLLNPYLQIHYFQSEEEFTSRKIDREAMSDADIMLGVVPSNPQQQLQLGCENIRRVLVEEMGEDPEEARQVTEGFLEQNLSVSEIKEILKQTYKFNNPNYVFDEVEYHQGTLEEANAYIAQSVSEHPFSYYFAQKFADLAGLCMAFLATVLLAFLFIRDSRRDTYELLHTKPVSASRFILGKLAGGVLAMLLVVAILDIIFTALCILHGSRAGLPVRFWDISLACIVILIPNLLMITCIYTVTALLFKNPLPAAPLLVLYIIYSNMGRIGPDGNYGYYGRLLAGVVRFPGHIFEISAPPMMLFNLFFLLLASLALAGIAVWIWKRRRIY